ncbi:UDP-N-acetylmuramoyl-tripeptide--D-alanyl-D-alanine ligase [Corynebacterium liangguodongii]|uniref:UDP-N-acetylmuramoyl-tripeptide--D-alanyl-D-alanine ligase n=1 Tax=Corynebacterium liangguodongii TaxID=2079535 RepID=A0A2S0WEZ8_9CORY|nr:UDP-N-acetylmuramoyl-tripeptide--D-alanyl-D-alanine ligase [Corynebacterium liangguodongii]AWB84357.1 UDP-N-acetylmuramoyl-tripeptide--D-alanyl-D-alanine ligase [Corynebacterium liangguodongii]PWB99847.1 UDP-N-acetylmuramoyl-tripeptide--D-alanyl-D-alanine ligase [Corynebacterium liangguodongii]
MIPLELSDIAAVTGGRLAGGAEPGAVVDGFVEFDSRKIAPGGLFVALPGKNVDGHDFARAAIDHGAVAVLAARDVGVPAIVVERVQRAAGDNSDLAVGDPDGSATGVVRGMSKLATHVAHRLVAEHGLTIVGVTGSAGKTSTKDLIAAVLSAAGETVAPPGSFNNEIGHPYTVLRCAPTTRYLVAEMSARGIGHIAHLATIAPPKIGVVLNIGSAHLGEFGSKDNIAVAKGELVEALPAADDGGVAILNADDPYVSPMHKRTKARVVYFSAEGAQGGARAPEYYATDVELDDLTRASFTLHSPGYEPQRVRLAVFGAHQVSNALAAAAVGIESGLDAATVARCLSAAHGVSGNRMDVKTRADGVTVINDAYNANPDSMRAGIAALGFTASARPGARSIAVLGEMGELGEDSLAAHEELGHELARYRVSHLVAVGRSKAVDALAREAQRHGIKVVSVPGVDDAAAEVEDILSHPPAGEEGWHERAERDVVLVKASNSQGLWAVAARLLEGHPLRGAAAQADRADNTGRFGTEGSS